MFSKNWIRLSVIVGFASCVSAAKASPVSYTFSGTLAQPFNGSTQFSGTLSFDTNLPPHSGIQPSPGWSYYSGIPADGSSSPVFLTFNLGNTPSSSFGNVVNSEVIVAHTPTSDGFFVYQQYPFAGTQNLSAEFGMSNNNLTQPGPFNASTPPGSLNLADFNVGANLTLWGETADGQQVQAVGTIASLIPPRMPPVPEPAPFVLFAVLGAGLIARRRLR
jgi:hypothetical protein